MLLSYHSLICHKTQHTLLQTKPLHSIEIYNIKKALLVYGLVQCFEVLNEECASVVSFSILHLIS